MTKTPGNEENADQGRRNAALALLSAFGAGAFLSGCTTDSGAEDATENLEGSLVGVAAAALTGTTNIRWVNKMVGTAGDPGLRDTTGAANHVAILTGYATPGDGGGGLFVWSTAPAADDGGTIVNPPSGGTNAGWRRMYRGPLDVRWFGILPNDGSDCRLRIQNLIDTQGNLAARRTVELYFPKGRYRIAAPGGIHPPAGLDKRLIIKGDRGHGSSQAPYGHADYLRTDFYNGTVLHGDPDVTVVTQALGAGVYSSLELKDLCIQTSGTGVCVQHLNSSGGESVIRFESSYLTTVGGQFGLRLGTYQPSRHWSFTSYGHQEHVSVASTGPMRNSC